MSIKVMNAVFARSKSKAIRRFVLLAIANHARDNGRAWPGVPRLAFETGLAQRTVRGAISDLQEEGELIVVDRAGPHGTNLYVVNLDLEPCSHCGFKGCQKCGYPTYQRWEHHDPDFDAQAAEAIPLHLLQGVQPPEPLHLVQGLQPEKMITPARDDANPCISRQEPLQTAPEPLHMATATPARDAGKPLVEPSEEPLDGTVREALAVSGETAREQDGLPLDEFHRLIEYGTNLANNGQPFTTIKSLFQHMKPRMSEEQYREAAHELGCIKIVCDERQATIANTPAEPPTDPVIEPLSDEEFRAHYDQVRERATGPIGNVQDAIFFGRSKWGRMTEDQHRCMNDLFAELRGRSSVAEVAK